ncbi:cyclopropane fatty acid synthase [Punctularia strigosozonata HHB-11173 SS5]|uniref:cyclopropane fatty acid synthase n=1 Tax=Punctularia strigosozonata (strain HHB-11173) TaxID=741275 RepID=UPI0004416296|nr:cyclopropane fatty acid synthase [Punctularia strigosozonata HHB-11173 SS5]EIN13978.1 cyclopropane fatty acid synthase [Punctularia strigosozonata HHB-11173 SS5]
MSLAVTAGFPFTLTSLSKSPTTLITKPRTWFSAAARSSILAFLEQAIAVGYLEIEDAQGIHQFGQYTDQCNVVHIRVINDNFWSALFLSGDLGFSEAFMIGDIRVDNLKGVFDLWLDNPRMGGMSSLFNRLSARISGISNALFGQSVTRARLNAMASYDQSNELFKTFLSREMMYSTALWGEEEGGVRGDIISGPTPDDLERAQLRKLRHVLKAARIKPGYRILEFGSGWGGFAIEAARSYGAQVDTLTLSIEQKKLAEERIKEAGLDGHIRVHLMDYRQLPPEFEKAFDAFVSIEMLEHVGTKYYETYFKMVDWALKDDGSTAVVTSSTFPECRFSAYQPDDFMRRYMWPNSNLPSATALVNAAHSASEGRFLLEGIENHAAHYPRTLRTWGRRAAKNLTPAALGLSPTTSKQYIASLPRTQAHYENKYDFDALKRKWEYLFSYAAAGFAKGYITCHMLTFTKNVHPVACD